MLRLRVRLQMVVARAAPVARRSAPVLVALALVSIMVLVVSVVTFFPRRAENPRVTASVLPAKLLRRLEIPVATEGWNQPAALAFLEDRMFVLDTGNNRILEMDDDGTVTNILDGASDGLALDSPMAMVSDGRYLYVANSRASEIVVLTAAGQVERVIPLAKVDEADEGPPRPIGIAITADGQILVSDARNHRVLRYDQEGQLLQTIGAGGRQAGNRGFNVPGGIAVDGRGNIYVVDILNGRVVQLAPDGTFLRQVGKLGDTAGTFSRPKDVAVDEAANIYVSDTLLEAVQAFSSDGTYLGFIGREKPKDRNSRSLFRAPAGLEVKGDTLYVMDRFLGVFIFQVKP